MTQLTEAQQKAWEGFVGGDWQKEVNVRDFIQKNYTPYEGDESFLADATSATTELWDKVMEGIKIENKTHEPLDFDTDNPSTITSHKPGYINKELEKIVGLQTDAPLKRAIMPFGGIKMVKGSCEVYGRQLDPEVEHIFTEYRKTHNQGVFDVYTPDILRCRKSGVLTGLPDAYGRGRIIGDYRRLAVYGVDFLMADKKKQFASLQPKLERGEDIQATIQLREEIAEQHRALGKLKEMAASYGYDISNPATNAQEAVQWTYFAYLAAVKSQNGAAMSFGRVSTFLDIYIERDLKNGKITEQDAQELIDHLVMKLRMVRFLRTPEYDQLFSGDPMWATETLAGMGLDGRTLVTKNSFRILHTLYTMGPSPEPNLTILWSEKLPDAFKRFCAKVSIDTSSVQYENDDLMRPDFNSDDYAIACCVSPMVVGKQMQFFGARANLAKTLLYAINGGIDEKNGMQVGPKTAPIQDAVLDFDIVMTRMDSFMDWLATQYVTALNIIHFMHDKYAYEAALMAFHDRDVFRTMACGIAGLSVAADSLSAIKYAKVKPIRGDIKDKDGNVVASNVATDFEIEGEYPQFGNNDPRVDDIACDLVERFMKKIQTHHTYRNATPTQSVLTITSNVVYGKKTGNTPDGRRAGAPFGPGANPMHGRDQKGAVASLTSVAKLPFAYAKDGISYTFSIVPNALGKDYEAQKRNLAGLMDGYFHHEATVEGGQHLNVNVMNREMLLDAMENPEKYPQLTIRVSGYAVRFNSLTKEQQQDVITRTFTQTM
ncbi:keto-acid formate acetyltransferase [Aggregatibacter actinomycetemcomitans serotype e str. SC936]|uniref:formate C-acetyltransferase n=1 Tax=Aggregatibacter actinomycetemcomitans TaxID=714 RepID=UPI00077EB047|nr:formate C-acetyltransferase [Aggregatibacter actinomycetemcomitans]KYK75939.1 keto-acid formate acetyltransferase [Aggregatibacter actinomycetemcomitans serotype e str. SA3096]KYK81922.1 keto-acid formate acetyltransferase [Aggregatibacter actinomycetemcomitans serotype e str. SC936]KYK96293.1 keto-acid formate acetyltransferase [Aggregatibacter actinomycetemcomitans serotype e str. ANH9776]TYB22629.1 formate C-acetyltransferase [Aggregatibacter actinomycetemcomitans]